MPRDSKLQVSKFREDLKSNIIVMTMAQISGTPQNSDFKAVNVF